MRASLTFDDGPSRWTSKVLGLLSEHNAKATFFVIGKNIHGNEHTLKRIIDEGHEIGNHTYSHHLVSMLSENEILAELGVTNVLINKHAGMAPRKWRAPHLASDDRADRIANELGLKHVGATVDPADWKSATVTTFRVVTEKTVDGSIVDLHDGVPPGGGTGLPHRWNTINALKQILEEIDAEWVTVSDLARVPA